MFWLMASERWNAPHELGAGARHERQLAEAGPAVAQARREPVGAVERRADLVGRRDEARELVREGALGGDEEAELVADDRAADVELDVVLHERAPAVGQAAEVVRLDGQRRLEGVAALARLDLDDAARRVAGERVGARRDHLDLAERVRAHVQPEAGPGERVLGRDAVDDVAGLRRAPAADVETGGVADDARLVRDHVLHVADGAAGDLLLGDDVGALGLLDVDQRLVAHDGDALVATERLRRERGVERRRLAVADGDAGVLGRAVADEADADGVVAGAQVGDAVVAVDRGGGAAARAEHQDRGAREGSPGRPTRCRRWCPGRTRTARRQERHGRRRHRRGARRHLGEGRRGRRKASGGRSG